MKSAPIDPKKYAAIRLVGERREVLKATIERSETLLAELPTASQLASDHNVPVNTVRQILRGRGYAGRSITKTVKVPGSGEVTNDAHANAT